MKTVSQAGNNLKKLMRNKKVNPSKQSPRANDSGTFSFKESELQLGLEYFSLLEDKVELIYKNKIVNFTFKVPQICFFKKKDEIKLIIEKLAELHHSEKMKTLIEKKLVVIKLNMHLNQSLLDKNFIQKIINSEQQIFFLRYLLMIALNLFLIQSLNYDNYDFDLLPDALQYVNNTLSLLTEHSKNFLIYVLLCIFMYSAMVLEFMVNFINNKARNQ